MERDRRVLLSYRWFQCRKGLNGLERVRQESLSACGPPAPKNFFHSDSESRMRRIIKQEERAREFLTIHLNAEQEHP